MKPSALSRDHPPSAVVQSILRANALAPCYNAWPLKKGMAAPLDAEKHNNGARRSITPLSPGDNVTMGSVPPWQSVLPSPEHSSWRTKGWGETNPPLNYAPATPSLPPTPTHILSPNRIPSTAQDNRLPNHQ